MKNLFVFTVVLTSFLGSVVNADVKPLVSVLISAKDQSHVNDIMTEIKRLSKKVTIVNVALAIPGEDVINLSALAENQTGNSHPKNPLPENSRIDLKSLEELGMVRTSIKFDDSLITRLRLSYSPTWIVRYKGKDYVFEGYRSIANYFTRTGEFVY